MNTTRYKFLRLVDGKIKMNTLYIEKKSDTSWGKNTNMPALERLLQDNTIMITPDKVERMPENYITNSPDGSIQADKK